MRRSDFRSAEQALAPGTGSMSARADALMSRQEAGKIAASMALRYGRLSPA
jgi:hypothetical protein